MERRVNMVVCWQLQFISDRVVLFYDLEWTNFLGTKLASVQAQLDIPGSEPD